jgi:toxin ParE1/3/4
MRHGFADPARRDLEDIVDYISLDNPSAAEKVYHAVVAAVGRLADFPDLGRPGRLSGTRELQLASLPHSIVYQVEPGQVTILAVFHGARDLARALAERERQIKR